MARRVFSCRGSPSETHGIGERLLVLRLRDEFAGRVIEIHPLVFVGGGEIILVLEAGLGEIEKRAVDHRGTGERFDHRIELFDGRLVIFLFQLLHSTVEIILGVHHEFLVGVPSLSDKASREYEHRDRHREHACDTPLNRQTVTPDMNREATRNRLQEGRKTPA